MKMRTLILALVAAASVTLLGGCATPLGNGTRTVGILSLKAQAAKAYAAGDREAALSAYQRYVKTAPEDAMAWTRIGNLHLMANESQPAIDAYRKSLAINRNQPEAWHNLSVVRLRQAHAAMLAEYHALTPGSQRAQDLACRMAWLTVLEQGGNGVLPQCKP